MNTASGELPIRTALILMVGLAAGVLAGLADFRNRRRPNAAMTASIAAFLSTVAFLDWLIEDPSTGT